MKYQKQIEMYMLKSNYTRTEINECIDFIKAMKKPEIRQVVADFLKH